jgi:DNA polymerase I
MGALSVDTEYGFRGGVECPPAFAPVIFCALDLGSGQLFSFWGRDPRLGEFILSRRGDVFISHSLMAEASYLLRLGVEPPRRWWDTMLGWRYVSNRENPPKYDLENVLTATGIPHAFAGVKDGLRQSIGNLRFDPDSPEDRRRIRDYCLEDCRTTAELYRRLVARVPADWMAYAVDFSLAAARADERGLPVDVRKYAALLERRREVVEAVTRDVNAVHPVFVNGRLAKPRFFRWCADNGIGWPESLSPRTGKKYLSAEDKVFKLMKDRHPFIKLVHEANKTSTRLNGRALAVDLPAGRHYFRTVPFGASSGRSSYKAFIFGAPKWMRYLVAPSSPEHRLVSVDFDAEEIAIAAVLSGDTNMLGGYTSGDPHMAFAILAGAAPPGATQHTHRAERKTHKAVNLGVNYGQTAYGIAQSTGMHFRDAVRLLRHHKRVFSAYWAWADAYTVRAFHTGRCRTVLGWPRKIGRDDNGRSVANFPVQGCGADLMRVAVSCLDRAGLPLLAVNHDSFFFECRDREVPEVRHAIDYALRCAVNKVLPGAPLRWTTQVYAERYEDEDGAELWKTVDGVLSRPTAGKALVPVGG